MGLLNNRDRTQWGRRTDEPFALVGMPLHGNSRSSLVVLEAVPILRSCRLEVPSDRDSSVNADLPPMDEMTSRNSPKRSRIKVRVSSKTSLPAAAFRQLDLGPCFNVPVAPVVSSLSRATSAAVY
jgi:hypothetical protein